jgi:hypothetical protein
MRETDHSPQTGSEVKKTWIYTPLPPTYIFMVQCLNKGQLYLLPPVNTKYFLVASLHRFSYQDSLYTCFHVCLMSCQIILADLIILIIPGEEYKLEAPQLCNVP